MATVQHIEFADPCTSLQCVDTMYFGLVPRSESMAELKLLRKNRPSWARKGWRRARALFNKYVLNQEDSSHWIRGLDFERGREQMIQVITNNVNIIHYTDPSNSF